MIFRYFLSVLSTFILLSTTPQCQSQYQLPKITVQAQPIAASQKSRISKSDQEAQEIKSTTNAIDLLTNNIVQQGYPEGVVIQGAKAEYSSLYLDDFQLYDHGNNLGNLSLSHLSFLENSEISIDTTNTDTDTHNFGGSVRFDNKAPQFNTSKYEVEAGSFDTHSHRLYHYQTVAHTKLQLGLNALQSRGFKDIPTSHRTNFLMNRRDPLLNLGGMIKVETGSPSSDWQLSLLSHQQHKNQNYKELGLVQNPERMNRSLFYLHGVTLKRKSFLSRWNPEFSVGIHGVNRNHQSLRAPFVPSDQYTSQTTDFNWNNIFKINSQNTINLGAKLSNDRYSMLNQSYKAGGSSVSKMRQQVYLGHAYSPFKETSLHAKIISTHRSNTRWAPSLSVGATQKFSKTNTQVGVFYHLLAHMPSLYQLHDTKYGNPNLHSERGHKVELKLDQKIGSSCSVTSSVYKTNITDAIAFIPINGNLFVGRYGNSGKITTYGIENSVRLNIASGTSLLANQNFCISKDRNNLQQIRIPQYKFGIGIRYAINEKTSSSFMYTHYGKTPDFQRFPPYSKLYIGGRGVMRATVSHIVNDGIKVFGRVENMLKREYENPSGYLQPGQAFYAGLVIQR